MHTRKTVPFQRKNFQTILPGTLNVFYILVIPTDNAQVSLVIIKVCKPGGSVIYSPKFPKIKIETVPPNLQLGSKLVISKKSTIFTVLL